MVLGGGGDPRRRFHLRHRLHRLSVVGCLVQQFLIGTGIAKLAGKRGDRRRESSTALKASEERSRKTFPCLKDPGSWQADSFTYPMSGGRQEDRRGAGVLPLEDPPTTFK